MTKPAKLALEDGTVYTGTSIGADGKIVEDFVFDETDRVVNVENAPSPAATAALNIGRLIVERIAPRFE